MMWFWCGSAESRSDFSLYLSKVLLTECAPISKANIRAVTAASFLATSLFISPLQSYVLQGHRAIAWGGSDGFFFLPFWRRSGLVVTLFGSNHSGSRSLITASLLR